MFNNSHRRPTKKSNKSQGIMLFIIVLFLAFQVLTYAWENYIYPEAVYAFDTNEVDQQTNEVENTIPLELAEGINIDELNNETKDTSEVIIETQKIKDAHVYIITDKTRNKVIYLIDGPEQYEVKTAN